MTRFMVAILLLTLCSVFAADLPPVPVRIDVPRDSDQYIPAMMTAAVVQVVNDRIKAKYPGLSRYARERRYSISVTDLPGDLQGRHTGGKRLIELDCSLSSDPARLSHVYAHEVGHAIYEGLSHIERQTVIAEFTAARREEQLPEMDIHEIFAELTARIATGKLSTKLPITQRIIRKRICK